MPVTEQWTKPNREFSDKVIYEYKIEQKGRIIREAAPGKSFTDLYFQDNWEPVAYYNLAEKRYVGINEYVGNTKKAEATVAAAVSKAEATPAEQKVGPEPAPPPPPPATSAPAAIFLDPDTPQESSPAVAPECPCKNSVSDGEKGVLNFGLTKDMLKNPNAAAIGLARQLGGSNGDRLAGLIDSAGDPLTGLTTALPALTRMQNAVNSQKTIMNAFENECNKFTTVRGLTSIISSLGLYADLACALGIEGVDVGVGLNVVNENGKFRLDYAVNANVDLEKVLNKFSDGAGTDLANAVKNLQSGLDEAFKAMDEVNNKLNEVINQAAGMQQQAVDFIRKYSDISSLMNLVNQASTDPCFKLGGTMNANLISPEFISTVEGAGLGGVGGGTSTR